MPYGHRNAREFLQKLNIEEQLTKGGTEAEVTYSYEGNKHRIKGLHYHSEKLWHPILHKQVNRSHVLDWKEYHDWWPEGGDNTDRIIEDMVSKCRNNKGSCREFLTKLCAHLKTVLANGDPGNLRHYWPNILNNNHWHDVASFIKHCLERPHEAGHLINLCQEGADVPPLNRLVYRWLQPSKQNKGKYKGTWRLAFHGEYQMIKRLLKPASTAMSGMLRKYPSGGEGKEHRELKEHFERHPEQLGLKDTMCCEKEWIFKSEDRADLVFWHKSGGKTVVEIETDMPDPGAHQLIKYRALLCAQNGLSLDSQKVRAILVAWSVPTEVREFCRKYGMSWQEHRLPR